MHDRIDVHQHLIPPAYREALAAVPNSSGWPLGTWDPTAAITVMDKLSIATGMLSVSAPGVHLGTDDTGPDTAARQLARTVNEYGAELVKDRPDRFGQFASIPLPDLDGALAEIAYAFDELHADGVVLMSNAHGRYLGDAAFAPVWAELDARGATVFIHPTDPPMPGLPRIPGPIVDYPADTTRTAVQLVQSGVMDRHTRIKVILSHAGGFVPFAAYRFKGLAMFSDGGLTPDGVVDSFRRFYFDTALSATPTALPTLLAFADPDHVLYGSDYPFAPVETSGWNNANLESYPDWKPDQEAAVDRGNAQALFPRLQAATGLSNFRCN